MVSLGAACSAETVSETSDPYGCKRYEGTWMVSCNNAETCTVSSANQGFDGCDITFSNCSLEGVGDVREERDAGVTHIMLRWHVGSSGSTWNNSWCEAEVSADVSTLSGSCAWDPGYYSGNCALTATKAGLGDGAAD
ncbi:MAG: hypothetical protein AMXMBFR56_60570 [Polyangiaceae bacterium]